MPRSSEPTRRALALLKRLQSRRSLSTSEAAALLGVEREVALEDLNALKEGGFAAHSGEGRYRRWTLVEQERGKLDRISLLFGRELASFLEGTSLFGGVEHAAEGLERTLDRFDAKFRHLAEPARRYRAFEDQLDAVLDGLLREHRLRIRYARSEGVEDLEVEPLTLVLYRRAVYLLARLPGDPDVLRLAVDRMADVQLGDPFAWSEDWDPDEELRRYFGITASGMPEKVVLRFSPEVARLVRARDWHPTAHLHPLPDGGVELRMQTSGHELVRFACEWGVQVEVIAPPSLRRKVRDELAGALARYERGST
jgi:predicted DNA-binding transcriptional regulator YafY